MPAGYVKAYYFMDSGKEIPPNWYTDTPQLIRGHLPLIEFSSFLIKLEYHVDLGCLHLYRENQIIKV